jgi:prophage regulatory protein
MERERVMNREEVASLCGLSTATMSRMSKNGQFPRARQIGSRRIGWLWSDVNEWLKTRPVAQSRINVHAKP